MEEDEPKHTEVQNWGGGACALIRGNVVVDGLREDETVSSKEIFVREDQDTWMIGGFSN